MADAADGAMGEAVVDGRLPDRRDPVVVAWVAAGLLALLALVFGDVLLGGGLDIPSHPQGDTARWYVYTRLFGVAELRAGNVPLWNPHTFSGMPFVGTFQSAVFYPPSWLHLLTDLRVGIVLEFVVSLFVLGMSAFAWLRGKGLRAVPCFVAAVVVIFASTVTLRVLAGQLSVLETFAWWPLVLRSIDEQARRLSVGWLLAGVGAVTMMILAGHPPTVLQAGLASGLYGVTVLWASPQRLAFVARLLPLAVAPPLLAAVQLFEGLGTASEALRRAGMSYAFAVSHSFPPEQLLTLLGPDWFGNADRFNLTYFGRVFYWDATFFFGVLGLLIALHGAFGRERRQQRIAAAMATLLCVLAMGGYAPFYRILYEIVPGFDYVRAPSKLLFFSSLFVAWLVALGVQRMLDERGGLARTAWVAVALAGLSAVLLVWAQVSPVSLGEGSGPMAWLTSLTRSPDFVVEGEAIDWHARFVASAAVACATAATAALLLFGAGRDRRIAMLFVGLAVVELLVFARLARGTTRMTIELDLRPQVVDAYARAGRTRVHETAAPSNVALARRRYAIWGYDPVILRRYMEFMVFSQGGDWRDIRKPTRFVPYHRHPLHAMLRVGPQLDWKTRERIDHRDAMPRFVFVDDHVVAPRDEVLDALSEPGFDPRERVVLETPPSPVPVPDDPGAAPPRLRLVGESTDHIDLEVELAAPKILVVTDAYSEGWRATARPGSEQQHYDVLPANYVLRAIPLGAGQHRLRLEYSPLAWRVGVAVTAVAGVLYLGAVVGWLVATLRSRARG